MSIHCPDCGSDLQFCAYETMINVKRIDPVSGKLKGQTKKVSDGNDENSGFISCSQCDWQIMDGMNGYHHFISQVDQKDISKVFCKINKIEE